MFLHRVLPPPPNLAIVAAASRSPSILNSSIPASTTGSIDEERMTVIADRPIEHGGFRGRIFGDQEEHTYHHSRSNIPRNAELSSPTTPLRSSTRLARRRERSESPPQSRSRRDTETRLPSISRDGDLTNSESPTHICLCQPDPKVPRPRNAFILFRQHYQAAVVQKNPGLANPDISKIIGDAWRSSSDQTKDHWKKLAEEEKIRHQKQYPDYRYQPRRAGRNSLTSSIATDPETQRCLKCGGKTMQAYNSLPAPGTPSSPRQTPTDLAMTGNTILTRSSRYIGSPQYASTAAEFRRFPSATGTTAASLSLRQREDPPQGSPDAKRRRYEGPISPPTRPGLMTIQSSTFTNGRRPSMPFPELVTRGHSMSNPRAHPGSAHPASAHPGSAHPASAHLGSAHPRTAHLNRGPGPALAPLKIDKNRDAASQAKAVEAMVMGIPALKKIEVLSKISPPLPAPGPASAPFDIRGALIAVEGADEEAVKLTGTYLKECLERDGDYVVRVVSKPPIPHFHDHTSWLDIIRSYHDEIAEIKKFMTTVPGDSSTSSTPSTRLSSKASTRAESIITTPTEDEDQTTASPKPTSTNPTPLRRRDTLTSSTMPIIIALRYQLSLTDQAASQIPINDEYSPTDHWQWMATLWRGTIGPDATINIQSPGYGTGSTTPSPNNPQAGTTGTSDFKDATISGSSASIINGNGTGTGHGGTAHNLPAVDVRLHDARAVFLRGEAEGKVSETGLRRMGFEVGEWLRDMEARARETSGRQMAGHST